MRDTPLPEEQLNIELWQVLKNIHHQRLLDPNAKSMWFDATERSKEHKLLEILQNEDAIEIHWGESSPLQPSPLGGFIKPMFLKIKPRFDEIYRKYEKKQKENYVRKSTSAKNNDIIQLELLEDKNTIKRITVYINVEYENPKSYSRGKNWSKMYELARDQQTSFKKTFFDYFNYNPNNPLYSKEGFNVTKILKQEDKLIVPNIKINLITQKKITQRLKSA